MCRMARDGSETATVLLVEAWSAVAWGSTNLTVHFKSVY